ncbi:MAG: hypothetical protein K8S25_14550 [Alphaproteobacteria bacterium]|nr:hypothetical protein [Alphaproteobacteria bacterium]
MTALGDDAIATVDNTKSLFMTLTQLDAFALTLLIEATVAAALGRALKLDPLRCALAAVAASSLTHPTLWAIYRPAQDYLGTHTISILEGLILATETLAYRALATSRWLFALLLSVVANGASWGAGAIIYALT